MMGRLSMRKMTRYITAASLAGYLNLHFQTYRKFWRTCPRRAILLIFIFLSLCASFSCWRWFFRMRMHIRHNHT